MSLELYNRVIDIIKTKRQRGIEGKVNAIPFGLPRFSDELYGIEQKTTYHVTANTKVGKTQITDYLFLYIPFIYAFLNRDKVRLKVFYFTLEMSKEQKYMQFMCFMLFYLSGGKIRIEPKNLRSSNVTKLLPLEAITILESDQYKAYFSFFEEIVIFVDDIKNPYGIYKFVREYAQTHGVQHKKMVDFVDEKGEVVSRKEIDDYYEPNDPEEYVEVIVDHIALLTPENGMDLRESICKFSSAYTIPMRNKWHYIPIIVVQQAAAQEGNENQKLGKLKPTLDGYGTAKIISQDADIIIGLFSPFRFALQSYEGYDITKFRDNIRFMELIAGREGGGGTVCPLFFDGGVNFFAELPLPSDEAGMRYAMTMVNRVNNQGMFLREQLVMFMHQIGAKVNKLFKKN